MRSPYAVVSALCLASCSAASTGVAPVDSGESTDTWWEPREDSSVSPEVSADAAIPQSGNISLSFAPTNIAGAALQYDGDIEPGVTDLGACEKWRIDTDAGKIECLYNGRWSNYAKKFTVVTQSGSLPGGAAPPKLGVFAVRNLRIPSRYWIPVFGANALVIVAQGTIKIEGRLLANAIGSESRASGFGWVDPSAGPGGGGAGALGTMAGGGGAGHCTAGAAGGNSGSAAGGAAGLAYGNSVLSPLVGGSSGGRAGNVSVPGGGGGGAIQLIAGNSIYVDRDGVINAGGGGGRSGDFGSSIGGGGAGSGGSILIEAPTVTIDGVVAANGGGGGSKTTMSYGGDYADANLSAEPALGRDGSGAGAAGESGPLVGGAGATSSSLAGGGGGAAGRIRIRTKSGMVTVLTAGVISPSLKSACTTQSAL